MPTMKERVYTILDNCQNNTEAAAKDIFNETKPLIMYVLTVGVDTLKSRRRRTNRREIKREINPTYAKGPVTGSVVFSKKTKEDIIRVTKQLFGGDGWMIGDINIGDKTKEDLLAQGVNEEASARGSLQNAKFYRALAEPMLPGQKVRDYWKNPADVLALKAGIWKETEGRRPTL